MMLNKCLLVLLLLSAFTGPVQAFDSLALDDFVLYADAVVELEKIADSIGNVGSNGQIDIKKGKCGTLAGDLRAVDRISNKGQILVAGNVLTAAVIDNHGTLTVNGIEAEGADLVPRLLPVLSIPADGSDLDVPRGGLEQLAPGSYGRIEVNRDAVLELSSGVYDLVELDTEKKAMIKINALGGAVTVNIAERLDIDEEVEIRITNGTTRDVTFNFSGAKKVEIEKKGIFRGSLIAPLARVEFEKNSRLEGRVIAAGIKMKHGVSFQFHENAAPRLAVVADAGVDRTVKVGDKVILDGSASFTTSGNPLTFQWSLASYPAGSQANFSDPAAVNPEFDVDLAGIYTAELIVNDGEVTSAPAAVVITAVPSQVDLDDFVIYADSEIRIDEIAGAIGFIGSNGKIDIEKGEVGTIEGDLWALGSIENKAEITVAGDVITNKQIHDKGHLTVTGTIFEDVNLPAAGLPQPVFEFSRDAPDLEAHMGSPLDLEPGSYGRIRVDKGAVLRLAGGEYAIKELDTGDRALIMIRGPVVIHLQKNLDLDDYVEWMISGSISTRDVVIYLHGKKAEIDDYAIIRGTVIAPRAKVEFKKYSRLHGAVFARKIDLDEGVYLFHHDQSQPQPTIHHRSIGTHTGALYETGTVSIAANSTRVIFAEAELPENIGRGDRIILNPAGIDREIAYILKRIAKNEVILQSPTVSSRTAAAYSIERAYNSIQSWEDDRQGDLVAENRREVGVCYNDGPFLSGAGDVLATIDGSDTDSARHMHLTVSESQRHYGLAGTGVVLDGQGVAKYGIRVLDDYTKVEHLELKRFRSEKGAAALEVEKAQSVHLEQLVIHDFQSALSGVAGIRGSDKSDFTARNCIIYNGDAAGIQTDGKGGTAVIQNCTIYGMQGRGIHEDKGTYMVQNTVALANGLEDLKIKRGRQSHNLSSDDTATGPGSLNNISAANQLVSIVPGQQDLHLKATAEAVDRGFDLSMFFEADVDGDRRPVGAAWDIGADEYLVPPAIEVNPLDRVVTEKEPVTFSVTATGSRLKYQWQKKLPDDVDFIDIDSAAGVEYTIPKVTHAENAAQYRCVVYNRVDRAVSDPATLSVELLPPDIKTHPINAEITEYQPVSFSVAVAGTLLQYQWQRSPGENAPFVDIAGATQPTYTIGSALYDVSLFVYRCKVFNLGNEPEYSDAASLKVNLLPPVINEQPINAEVTEYQPASFSVTAEGTLLEYQWQKSTNEAGPFDNIAGAAAPAYTIDSAQYEDSKYVYRCQVTNLGNDPVYSAAVRLTVNLLPPDIKTQPGDVTATEKQSASFSIEATGTLLEYQWQRSPNENDPFVEIAGATESTYTIDSTQYDDSLYIYRCQVSNIGNEPVYSNAAQLAVNLLPPTINEHPADTEVTEFLPASLSVIAEGTLLEYQWQKSENAGGPFVDIADATASLYEIESAQYDDSQFVYRCQVTNLGNDPVYSDSASLKVNLLPPVINEHPTNAETTEYQEVSFSVTVDGTLLEYQWQRSPSENDPFVDIAGATEPTYAISSTQYDDSRYVYRCKVFNLGNEPEYSDAAGLKVNLLPPVIQTQPVDTEVIENQRADFSVSATGTLLEYRWQRERIDESGNLVVEQIAGATDPLYTIEFAQYDASAWEYRCLVTNIGNEVASDTAGLTVNLLPPIIESQPLNTEVTEKDPATFSISATGTLLKYQWQKKLAAAPEADPFDDITAAIDFSYTIAAVKYEDRLYIYRSRVSNLGNDPVYSDAAALTINLLPPVVTQHPNDTEVTEKQPASFSVIAEGTLLEYQWQKKQPNAADFEDIADATEPQYTIPSVEYADRGNYRCVVTNLAASIDSSDAILTVKLEKPEITTQPADLTITDGDPAALTIEATGTLLKYQWQKQPHGEAVFVNIAGATAALFNLPAATLADHGTYRCLVSNIDWADVPSHEALMFVEMKVPDNTTPVSNASAVWQNAHAGLAWNSVQGFAYRVYRGSAQDNIAAIADSNDPRFIDTGSNFYNTYYYRLATVKHITHPYAGKVYESVGPLSDIVTLAALSVPKVTIAGAVQAPDGKYSLTVGKSGPYDVQGTYAEISGAITAQAKKSGSTINGSGTAGTLSIQLPEPGTWEIKVSEAATGKYIILTLILVIDENGPQLTVDGPVELTTGENIVVIAGAAADKDAGLDSVNILSDRYAGNPFGTTIESNGKFSAEVPLKIGANQLSVIAADNVGNQTRQGVTVTVQPVALPRIIIHAPANGSTVAVETITVAGEVRSSLPPEQIRLELAEQVVFPTGADSEYSFEFKNIRLVKGSNTLTILAATAYGTVQAQTTVSYLVEAQAAQLEAPTLEIDARGPEIYVSEDHVVVQGAADSDSGIQRVTVNGQEVDWVGSDNYGTFESQLYFTDPDQGLITITVAVTDKNGQTTTVTYVVRHDSSNPVIELADPGLQFAPAVNTVGETPYTLSGTVADDHLAGFSINDQSVALLPAPSGENQYTFEAGIPLIRGNQVPLALTAWDHAGNRARTELILLIGSDLEIEIITPRDGAELPAGGQTLDVAVTARVPGMAADDQVRVQIDAGDTTTLSLAGSTANGTVAIGAANGEHQLAVEVVSASDTVLARRTSRFSVVNTANIALAMERQEPANSAAGVEPNEFIAVYFNKPVDPQQLQIQVLETVHGLIYDTLEKGADITQLSRVELVEVHRDREPVPGGISQFPGNTMAAFYPQRDFGYGATVYVDVLVNNQSLSRTSFTVRPLPTFIQGFVADQFMQPIAGLTIEIPELGRTATTDGNGSYGIGFGDKAQETIPSGRYRGVINPDLNNRTFGTVERWINVEGGHLNSVGMTLLPILNPEEPFRHIASGQPAAVLAGGDLTLGLAGAALIFPDGRDQGDVHVQFMKLEQIAYPSLPSATPNWAFAVQPMGVEVSGPVALTFAMPPLYGSHDYAAHIGERVILVGYDPAALQLVPVGVGLVDADNHTVSSEGTVALERLDYLGYALVDVEDQAVLQRFANGEISLRQMIGELEGQ